MTSSDWWRRRSSLSPRGWGVSLPHLTPPLLSREALPLVQPEIIPVTEGMGGYPSHSRLRPPPHVTRSHWWTVTSCLSRIGRPSRAWEHKRPRQSLVQPSIDGQKSVPKPERKEVKKRSQAKMQEERPVEEEKGAREQERAKREVEGGGSQEKKRKVVEQAPLSYWNWLPPELKEDIEKKALYALIQERLDKGFRAIHGEMAELPRCRLHGTVSRGF